MKKYIILVFTGLFGLTTLAEAENTQLFKVMATSGITLVERYQEKENWKPIKPGTRLSTDDKVLVTEGSYLAIMHITTGKSLELKTAGVFKVNDLNKRIEKKEYGMIGKYSGYLYADIMNAEERPPYIKRLSLENQQRDAGNKAELAVLFPNRTYLTGNQVEIKWESEAGAGKYFVEVRNMFEDELFSTQTRESSITLDLSQLSLAEDQYYLVRVSKDRNGEGSKVSFFIPATTDLEFLDEDLQVIKSNIDENSALGQMILGAYYEDHQYYLDALSAYNRAVELAPEVGAYQEIFRGFLERHHMNDAP